MLSDLSSRLLRVLAFAVLFVGLGCDNSKPTALVVLAHPDDELAIVDYLLLRGADASLLFLTRGETDEAPQGRSGEAEGARALYGSTGVELVAAPIGRLTLDPTAAWESWDVEALIGRVRRRIDRDRPTEIVTWMPNVVAVHGEHQVTGAIVTAACLAARHPPRRILYLFQAYKVGYYRMGREVLDPVEMGMRVETFRAALPLESLASLYPSAGIDRWLGAEADAYREGSRLASFSLPRRIRPLGPPRSEGPLPGGDYRVLPHFGAWLRDIGLDSPGRIIALVPGPVRGDRQGPLPLSTAFDEHEVRRELHDGFLYVLLPRDVADLAMPGGR